MGSQIVMVNGRLTSIILESRTNVLITLDTIGFMIKAFRPVIKLLSVH